MQFFLRALSCQSIARLYTVEMSVTTLPSIGVILLSELANDFIDVIHLLGKGAGTAAFLDNFALGGVLPVRSGF